MVGLQRVKGEGEFARKSGLAPNKRLQVTTIAGNGLLSARIHWIRPSIKTLIYPALESLAIQYTIECNNTKFQIN